MILTINIEVGEGTAVCTTTDAGRVLGMVLAEILNHDHQPIEVLGISERVRDIDGEHVGFYGVTKQDR